MPKRTKVDDPQEFYKKNQRGKNSIFECLLDVGTDWTFVPGEDFPKGYDPKRFMSRLRNWAKDRGYEHRRLAKYHEDGSVTIRFEELTDEERRKRQQQAEKMRAVAAATAIRKRQAEARQHQQG